MPPIKILIVGAGIAGLSMLRALRDVGLDADIIEKTPDWNAGGAGICLPANCIANFKRLGIAEEILEQAHRVHHIEYALHTGKSLSIASLSDAPLNQEPFVALPRTILLDILAKNIDSVRFDTYLTEIRQRVNQVAVRFNNNEQHIYDLVIAADGMNSQTRKMTFDNTQVDDLGLTNWRFIIERNTQDMHPVYYIHRDDAFMLYPIAKDKVYCYAHISDPDMFYFQLPPLQVMRDKFNHYLPEVVSSINAITDENDIITGRIQSVGNTEVANGRVVLIGDALHACPPTLQQGAAQTLEDVLALAPLLADYHTDIDKALAMYKDMRMAQFQWVIDESNKIMRLSKIGRYWLGRVLRNAKVRRQGPTNVTGWRTIMERFSPRQ